LIHHPPITVRPLGAAEWQLKRDLRLAALQDSPSAFASSYDLEVHRSEQDWRDWPRDGAYFAAFDGLQAALGIAGSWMRAGEPDVTHLISMWVAPDARGAGIAGLLTAAVVEWAREQKAARVELEVAAGNDAAMRAYLRNGFAVMKRTPSAPGGTVLERALSVSHLT
jgi:ribosomal protein S18 acetylase RimI-like enzyme